MSHAGKDSLVLPSLNGFRTASLSDRSPDALPCSGVAAYHEIQARTVTRLPGVTDPWFIGRYGMNLYRGCEHGCAYCDGRAERYYVAGAFDGDIQVKRNAVEVLARELDRVREPGFVLLGGGVCDAYQPAEERFLLARGVLELCRDRGLPVHVLTKSALVERDLDLCAAIATGSRVILSFSIATTDESLRERFEPRASPLHERWRLIARAKRLGLGAGVMAMPLLPGLSDQPAHVEALVRKAREVGADFVCISGLTLRPGVQMETYLRALREGSPELLPGYEKLYAARLASGAPDRRYLSRVEARGRAALAANGLPGRPPWPLFRGMLPTYAEVGVLLEHRGFERGESMGGPLSRAGWQLQRWARSRMASRRDRGAYRAVEAELAMLVKRRRVEETGVVGAVVPDVEEVYAQVEAAR